jgi:O-antigen/teichoic acid export membrane protein
MAKKIDSPSRIRTVGLNTSYQIGSQVAPAIAAILAIPFLLRHLGSEVFGIVMIFSTSLAYFTMLDLGLGRAATRFIAQSLEAGQPDDLRRYFWGSIALLTGIGAIVTVLAFLAVPTVVSRLLKIPPLYVHSASQSLSIICLTIPLVTLMATFRGFLEASGRFAFISIVTGCGGVGLYLLPALTVSLGGQLVGVAVALCLVRVGMCIALAIGCLYLENGPSLHPIFDVIAVKRMLSFGGWLSVSNIVGTATIYCDRFLLGACVSMAAVTSYGMPLDVINRLQILIGSFCAVLFPLMSRLDGSGSDQFQRVYRGAIAVALSLMTLIATWAAVAIPTVMKFWLGARSTPDSIFAAQIFLAGAVMQSSAAIAWTALHARGRSDLTAWVHLAEFPLYCTAFYFAATRYGVRGAALAWFGRGIVDFLCMAVLLRIQRRNEASGPPPELVAAIVSLSIVSLAFLPTGHAVPAAVAICCLTFLWSWRMVLDAPTRGRVVQLMLRREATRPA